MPEIILKIVGDILIAAIAVIQFFPSLLAFPATRWIVALLAFVAVTCVAVEQIISNRRQKRERTAWEDGQSERDRNLVKMIAAQMAIDNKLPVPALSLADATPIPALVNPIPFKPTDPRVYPTSVKESGDNIFPKTPFVLTNRGGDVAHKVRIEWIWKLNGRNVTFDVLETLPAGESAEFLPNIEEESMSSKHDIFHWLVADWNGNSRGITEDWPKPINIHWKDFSGKDFTTAATLVFHPIKYLLKSNTSWPGTRAKEYVIIEFKDVKFA